jgi:superfamily II DNA or RNA helicase
MFDSFGLTIIDEVHHISSEVFSNALFKIVTKNMLGLSATMNRKDGTTNVIKMFLGDVIFKGKRDEERLVQVRGVQYITNDDEFNSTAMDYRGNAAYSTMISKLCEYNRRSEFILKIVVDLLEENAKQQIMILAHNKNLLKYLYDAIEFRKIATVGYYVGGMKEKALKETESKNIVIATYAMASEALDIKTLTTLVMATPKTDIEQSVGRILREKHSNPIVVDIIDSHEIFQKQWNKRKKFYKKENYNVIFNTNLTYDKNIESWKKVMSKCQKSCRKNPQKIQMLSHKNKSFSDRSVTTDSESDTDDVESNNNLEGQCFLKIK